MNIDLTPIFQAAIALLYAIVIYKVIPWIRAKTTSEERSLLMAATKTLVFAAEQLYGAGNGADKLDYVIRQLEAEGFTADRAMIEATIKEHISQLHAPKLTAEQNTGENVVE